MVPVAAPFASFSPFASGAQRRAARVLLGPHVAVAADLDGELLRERVDDRHADAVQPAGDLVAATLAELAAGVQDGEHDFDSGLALLLHHRHRDPAPVVDDRHGVVGVDRHLDLRGEAREGLVDGVVDHLVDEVVQPERAGRADVHAGALANGFEALEDGDVLGVVGGRCAAYRRVADALICGAPLGAFSACRQWPSDGMRTPRIPGRETTATGRIECTWKDSTRGGWIRLVRAPKCLQNGGKWTGLPAARAEARADPRMPATGPGKTTR